MWLVLSDLHSFQEQQPLWIIFLAGVALASAVLLMSKRSLTLRVVVGVAINGGFWSVIAYGLMVYANGVQAVPLNTPVALLAGMASTKLADMVFSRVNVARLIEAILQSALDGIQHYTDKK